jgi:hypothetical protein
LLISWVPGARSVATNMGREAFFDPLMVTSPESFLPPLITSLSNSTSLAGAGFCPNSHLIGK